MPSTSSLERALPLTCSQNPGTTVDCRSDADPAGSRASRHSFFVRLSVDARTSHSKPGGAQARPRADLRRRPGPLMPVLGAVRVRVFVLDTGSLVPLSRTITRRPMAAISALMTENPRPMTAISALMTGNPRPMTPSGALRSSRPTRRRAESRLNSRRSAANGSAQRKRSCHRSSRCSSTIATPVLLARQLRDTLPGSGWK